MNPAMMQKLKKEFEIAKSLNHDFVQRYFSFVEQATLHKASGKNKEVAYMVTEIMHFSLIDHLEKQRALTEPICRYIFKQILEGTHYIHASGFSHGNLTLDNLYLDN
mmetsp:Transcript_14383/g.17165  ORF Transcript_14383/g.17165 Transcript_14383/m.17165 type:complete len:107 (-) Transcript_14383:527-847(-)